MKPVGLGPQSFEARSPRFPDMCQELESYAIDVWERRFCPSLAHRDLVRNRQSTGSSLARRINELPTARLQLQGTIEAHRAAFVVV